MSLTTETVFPPINDVMDSRLGQNLIARGAGLRLTYIPKNMCSTLKLSMLLAEGKIGQHQVEWFAANARFIHDWAFQLEARHPLELGGLESVVVVRNPAARLASGLVEKVFYADEESFGWIVVPTLERFIPMAGRLVEEMTVADFLNAVAFLGDRHLNTHFRSQVAFLSGRYDRVLSMEDRDRTASYFASRNIPLQTADQHSVSRAKGAVTTVDVSTPIAEVRKVAKDSVVAQRTLPQIDMTDALRAAIIRTAASRFGSDFALWEQARSA